MTKTKEDFYRIKGQLYLVFKYAETKVTKTTPTSKLRLSLFAGVANLQLQNEKKSQERDVSKLDFEKEFSKR